MYVGNIQQWKEDTAMVPSFLQPWIEKLAELALLPPEILTTGRHDLTGPHYFNVDESQTAPAADRPIEAHQQYVDIQFLLEGAEDIGWQPLFDAGQVQSSQPEKDLWFYDGSPEKDAVIHMTPGTFALFSPADGHRTLCAPDGTGAGVRKIIMKIHV